MDGRTFDTVTRIVLGIPRRAALGGLITATGAAARKKK